MSGRGWLLNAGARLLAGRCEKSARRRPFSGGGRRSDTGSWGHSVRSDSFGRLRATKEHTKQGVIHGPALGPEHAQEVIERIDSAQRKALAAEGGNLVFSGTGTQLGLESTWRFIACPNGQFREEVSTSKFKTVSGYNGKHGSLSWSGDHTGLSSYLDFDDHELVLLASWARTGLWSSSAVRSMLDVDLISSSVDEQGDSLATVRIRIKDGRVNGTIVVDMSALRPRHVGFHLRSDSETMEFLDWDTQGSIHYPKRIEYETASGTNVMFIEEVSVASAAEDALFSIPTSLPMALDTEFREPSHQLPAWVTRSGHILINATIDGDHDSAGYWLFDTGASGSVIDSAAAAELGLESFGSFKVKGMAGDLDGNFRECKSLEIGPLVVKDMLMMEMDCSGLVRGAPGPVVGIIGCDIMSRAVFDIPQIVSSPQKCDEDDDRDGVSSLASAMAFSTLKSKNANSSLPLRGCREIRITMSDPRIEPKIPDESKWMDVKWVSSLPHLKVNCVNGGVRDEILFMIDSGAGGMQLMMNGLTASQLSLLDPQSKPKGTRTVRGVGGSSGSNIRLHTKKLTEISIGNNSSIENVDCLVADDGIQGGVELSHYTGGVLCNEILVKYRFVIDLVRDRMALV
jgi:predicted aspartyl protease